MNKNKLVVAIVLLALIIAFFVFDLGHYFSLAYLKSSQAQFAALYDNHPAAVIGVFFAIYVAVTALSFPGAAVMTLAAGAIFGLLAGTIIVSFASSIGATLAFLAARFVLRDSVQSRFGARLAEIDKGVAKEGAFYLFTLRLVPLVPFFVINLLMGLTKMKTATFYWEPAGHARRHAGVRTRTQLAKIDLAQGHPVARADRLLRAARRVPNHRQEGDRCDPSAARLRALARPQAEALRPQPGGHRCRCGGSGQQLHRCRGEGQGDAGRRPQDGR
jgi:uncharacterized membrane protein YdjX (TVP38/TMEM64 family)